VEKDCLQWANLLRTDEKNNGVLRLSRGTKTGAHMTAHCSCFPLGREVINAPAKNAPMQRMFNSRGVGPLP